MNIKKIIFFFGFCVSFMFLGFGQQLVKPEMLTKDRFIKEVYNYEKTPTQWVYEGKKPCVIDCYADWCGPCRRLSPILDTLATEYAGKVTVYKVNTSVEKELAAKLFQMCGNTRGSIPMLMFIPAKGQPQVLMGLRSKADLKQIFDNFLLK